MGNVFIKSDLPRTQQIFFQNFINNETIFDDFRKNPKQFLANHGVNVDALNLPENFEVPPKEILEKRFQQYFGYDEFGTPTMYAVPFVVFLVFLVPIPAY